METLAAPATMTDRSVMRWLLLAGATAVQIDKQFVEKSPKLEQGRLNFVAEFGNHTALPAQLTLFNIYFIGDSTGRNLFHALCIALTGHTIDSTSRFHAQCKGLLGRQVVAAYFVSGTAGCPEAVSFLRGDNASEVAARGAAYWIEALARERDRRVAAVGASYTNSGPNAVYFSHGLWQVYPVPFQLVHVWDSYRAWRSYEVDLETAMHQYTDDAPTAVLIAGVPHIICEHRMRDTFAVARDFPNATIDRCAAWLHENASVISSYAARRDCTKGRRSHDSMVHMGTRLRTAVARFQVGAFHDLPWPSVTDHDLP